MKAGLIIRNLAQAYSVIKEMNLSLDWESDYQRHARETLVKILQGRMWNRIDRHLEEMARRGESDRRNGAFWRHLLTELGDIVLRVFRTRRKSEVEMVREYRQHGEGWGQITKHLTIESIFEILLIRSQGFIFL